MITRITVVTIVIILCLFASNECVFGENTNNRQSNIEKWILQLQDNDPDTRIEAAKELSKTESALAVTPLIESFKKERDEEVRIWIIRALSDFDVFHLRFEDKTGRKGQEVVDVMIEAMKDQNEKVRRVAIYYFDFKNKRVISQAVPYLTEALSDSISDVRSKAAKVLGGSYDPRAVPYLIVALKDKSKLVRKYAANSLGRIGDSNANLALIELLDDKDQFIRKECVDALMVTPEYKTIITEKLVYLLDNDKSPQVRHTAASRLGRMADPSTVIYLVDALHDENEGVRNTAATALGKIDKSKAYMQVKGLLESDSVDYRIKAAWALGRIGSKEAIPDLLKASSDNDKRVRRGAVWSLAEIGGADVIEFFESAKVNQDLTTIVWGCQYYIKKGEEGSEDIIIDAFKKHGDKIAALVLLNCGNIKLSTVAKNWAKKHGYMVSSFPSVGSSSISWGKE